MIEQLSIEKIHPSKQNPRKAVGDVTELAASMKEHGVLLPLIVEPDGKGGYELVAGERRLAAAKKAELGDVPAIVREDLDDRAKVEIRIIENLHREDLNPIEEASGYKQLVDLGLEQQEVAERVGRSQSHLSKRLALLELPAAAQRKLLSGGISLSDAAALARLKDHPKRIETILARADRGFVEYQVRDHLDAIRIAEKKTKLKERLKKKGMTVVSAPSRYGDLAKDKPARLGKYGNAVDVAVARHEKQDCHAVAIGSQAEVIPVCVKPQNHRSLRAAAQQGTSRSEPRGPSKKFQAHVEALKAGEPARVEVVRSVLKRKVNRAEAFDLLAEVVFDGNGEVYMPTIDPVVCAFLGAGEMNEKGEWVIPGGAHVQRLVKGDNDEDRARVLVAVVLSYGEDDLGQGFKSQAITSYLRYLERHGHKLTPEEKLEMQGKPPKP